MRRNDLDYPERILFNPELIDIEDLMVPITTIVSCIHPQSTQLFDLRLHGCSISSQECLTIALNEKFSHVTKLDLSCNPIGFEGLYYLVNGN
jgi:hypothetical protein